MGSNGIVVFQSTPPVKAATDYIINTDVYSKFQSTPPVKAATEMCKKHKAWLEFQSTPPVKAATHEPQICAFEVCISIHAAREGGDDFYPTPSKLAGISIHAAREGGDDPRHIARISSSLFQSTPPVKAATMLSILDSTKK